MKTNDKLTEKIDLLISGSNDVFPEIYNESYRYLHTCVIHIVKNEDLAQDMLQDTYIEIYRNIDQLKKSEDFLSWASTIANRKCFAYIRKNRDVLIDEKTDEGENDLLGSVADDESFIPENIFDNLEKIRIIRDIIDGLTDVQRACVIGFYYNDQKQDEIASQLGIPVNTVKSHLNRAKAKIKEAVRDVEKKQDIKLYSFAPFMLLLFSYETKTFGEKAVVPKMGESLTKAVAAEHKVSAVNTENAANAKAIKTAASAVKVRIAIGAAVVAVSAAAATGVYLHNKNTGINTPVEEQAEIPAPVTQETNTESQAVNAKEPPEETKDAAEATDTDDKEAEETAEVPVPDAEANHVEFVDSIATNTPVWVVFTNKENDESYINPDPDCSYKDAGAFLELTDVSMVDTDDENKEYTITFTQDIKYTLRYPTSYEHMYHFYYLEGLHFYDYYTGKKLNVTETSMDVGEMEKEGEMENHISWDGKDFPVTIHVQKDRENGYGDETNAGGFYETPCLSLITFTYTVTCPKDYDGLCVYVLDPSKFPADAEERNRKANYDENGKAIEKSDPSEEKYLFKDEDDLGIIPTADDLFMMRITQ